MKDFNLFRSSLAVIVAVAFATPSLSGEVRLPPAGGQYDSQLGDAYSPPPGTMIVSRDREDPVAEGLYNICYVNAFQTQPQDASWWIENHPDLLLRRNGKIVEDPNWPGEMLLDTSSQPKRDELFAIVAPWIEKCSADGYNAIEADNLDTYSRSNDSLTIDDNLAFATALTKHAHALGMAFAQKNGGELGPLAKSAGFDFAILESCQLYDECDAFTNLYGRYVLEIEYTDTNPDHFKTACDKRGRQISVIQRDRGLSIPGTVSYFYQTC